MVCSYMCVCMCVYVPAELQGWRLLTAPGELLCVDLCCVCDCVCAVKQGSPAIMGEQVWCVPVCAYDLSCRQVELH